MLSRNNVVVCLVLVLFLFSGVVLSAVEKEVRELKWEDPTLWKHDGMWTITKCDEGVKFHKDEKAAHNSQCWLKLDEPLKLGQTIEITYKMEVPFKHVDIFMGDDCVYPPRKEWMKIHKEGGKMPEFAEVLSLGNRPETSWVTARKTITNDAEINTFGFLSWGWRWAWRDLAVDVNTWMKVKEIKVLSPDDDPQWFEWRVPEHICKRSIPRRSGVQDFFPFGVYISVGSMHSVAKREGKTFWELMDDIFEDLSERGLNFTTLVNTGASNLDKFVELHKHYGLHLNPACSDFDLKHIGWERVEEPLKKAVVKYRGDPVIGGWGAGEEFPPKLIKRLVPAHDMVHELDPYNTIANVHNWMPDYHLLAEQVDVRIVIRDIYPWHGIPHIGPATPESSIYYYEHDLERCQQLLPKGATLWVCAQGHGEGGPVGKGGHYMTPTLAQIRLQTWAALAHGVQGFEWFVYHSEGTPERAKFDGLRAFDGSPTGRLIELGRLARKLIPVGHIITRWHKYREAPAETDNRDLRAYMFVSDEGGMYLVVYNRSAQRATAGKIGVPFKLGAYVTNLMNSVEHPVEWDGKRSVFSVSFESGSGTIFSLGRQVP